MTVDFYRIHQKRFISLIVFLMLGIVLVIMRLVYLTCIDSDFLRNQGDIRTMRNIVVPVHRGIIEDRNGEAIAVNMPKMAVCINAQRFCASTEQLTQLALLLNCPVYQLKEKIQNNSNKRFIYLKRGLDIQLTTALKALKLKGLFLRIQYRRYYPQAEINAHLLGLTNIDNQGQEGLELIYHNWLHGVPGLKRVIQDRRGNIIAAPKLLRPAQPGRNLQLSLDQRIQCIAFHALASGVKRYQAQSGTVIVLGVKTGEVLAMANYPSYDPNQPILAFTASHRNSAVTDVFEPGSALKPFSIVSLLEHGHFTKDSLVDTTPGKLKVDDSWIKDKKDYGLINLEKVLQVSSNVGIAKLILAVSSDALLELLIRLGFGHITNSGFPGELKGFLPRSPFLNAFELATLSFGYGVLVTPLQLAQAYSTLANNGVKVPVTFIKQHYLPVGRKVINAKVSKTILRMLESVLEKGGTAPLARIKGYRVTGKTGTTRLVRSHGYDKAYHNSVFVGIAPAEQPEVVVLVLLHNLQTKNYYSGSTAGVIFAEVMFNTMRILNIAPTDQIITGR